MAKNSANERAEFPRAYVPLLKSLRATQNKSPGPAFEFLNDIIPLKKNHSTGFENLGYFFKFKNFLTDDFVIHNTFYFKISNISTGSLTCFSSFLDVNKPLVILTLSKTAL